MNHKYCNCSIEIVGHTYSVKLYFKHILVQCLFIYPDSFSPKENSKKKLYVNKHK